MRLGTGTFYDITPKMSPSPPAPAIVALAKQVLAQEAHVLAHMAQSLPTGFTAVLAALKECHGHVIVTGVGKSGHVGRKLAATLASVGTPSVFMHAAEAVHGDLGQITAHDVVLALSYSGASREVVALLAPLQKLGTPVLALVGRAKSALAQGAQHACILPDLTEACPMNMVPTVSTTAMLAVGDAWAMSLFAWRQQGPTHYALRHPGGSLGQALREVGAVMRTGPANPVVSAQTPLRAVLQVMGTTPGRPGAAAIIDDSGRLVGMFTDGDLRRLVGKAPLEGDTPIAQVMHPAPLTVAPQDLLHTAARLLQQHGVDQLPVVNAEGCPVGLLDIQDLLPEG
jgi:arabinose-5-phosphate isomerase